MSYPTIIVRPSEADVLAHIENFLKIHEYSGDTS